MTEHFGNGVDPQRPSLPEKLLLPNLVNMASGKCPWSSLLVILSSMRLIREEARSGTSPESSLFCNRRVRRCFSFDNSLGISPWMLLSEMSSLMRRRKEDISGGISPEKSLPER